MFKLPIEIIEGIKGYKNNLEDLIAGRIDSVRFTSIRVPWGIYSHRGKVVFMARIRVPAGVVTAEQLKAISYAVKTYGSGIAHLTTRQDIQIHRVKMEDTIKVIEYLKDFNLSSRGGGGNTVRNITSCVLSGICQKEVFDVRGNAIALSEQLLREESSFNLPRKFKVAFSGCAKDCAGCLVNDVGLFAQTRNNKRGFKVFVGGGMGKEPRLGQLLEEFMPEEELGYSIEAIKNIFYKHGDRKNKHRNRLRFLIEDMGFSEFKGLYQKELGQLREKEHIVLRKIVFPQKEETDDKIPQVEDREYKEFLKYNVYPQERNGFSNIQLRIPRGDITAEELSDLAGLENDFGKLEFRTSPNQNLFVCAVKNQDIYKLFLRLKGILRELLYPESLLDVVACKGALTCNLGLCNSPGLAKEVEYMISKDFLGTKVFDKLNIKINGCPNACGHHPLGKISFYGMVKRVDNRPVPFYKLLLGGRKEAQNSRLGREIDAIPAKNIPAFLKQFLKLAEERIGEEEDIHAFLDEEAPRLASEILADYLYVPPYSQDKSFYIDWGKEEEFSLDGLGPGECGAGVLDMIESDLTQAKIALQDTEKGVYSATKIRKAIFFSARALLLVKGKDPRSEEEAVLGFKQIFVDTGIASGVYANIKETLESVSEALNPEERKEKFLYAKGLFEHVDQLYRNMDSSFNFPAKRTTVKVEASHLLDLKGTPCPINYVKTKLFLEGLKPGDTVEVLLDEGEPINNVPKSLEGDGHQILKIEKKDGFYKVIVKKGG